MKYSILAFLISVLPSQSLLAEPDLKRDVWQAQKKAISALRAKRLRRILQMGVVGTLAYGSFFAMGRHFEVIGGVLPTLNSGSPSGLEALARLSLLSGSFGAAWLMNRYLRETYDMHWALNYVFATSVGLALGFSSPPAANFCREVIQNLAEMKLF